MIDGKFFITPHAVRQYMSRYSRTEEYNIALTELIRLSNKSRFIKNLYDGIELWRTGKPLRMRMIVSSRFPGKKQIITILKGCDKWK